MQQEKFEVGELNQIALKNDPQKYPSFSIRNLASSGEVWSGREGETVRCYDLNPENMTGYNNENTRSIALRFDYGPFSYYSGGDVSGSLHNVDGNMFNVESLVGEVCGEVDVCKANHHSYKDAMPEDTGQAVYSQRLGSAAHAARADGPNDEVRPRIGRSANLLWLHHRGYA